VKISKKCQYALKAVFELGWRNFGEPVKTQNIAQAQRMSLRFTEVILNELRHGGVVESRRGNEGGYMLARDVTELTVREVIECIEGPVFVAPDAEKNGRMAACNGNDAFRGLWHEVNDAVCEVFGKKTFADLIAFERAQRDKCALNYNI
jgi:Rrf2 family protein